MYLESAIKDVEAVGVDSGEQETRPKKANSGGTERVPGKSVFPVARVQKTLKADKVDGHQHFCYLLEGIDDIWSRYYLR